MIEFIERIGRIFIAGRYQRGIRAQFRRPIRISGARSACKRLEESTLLFSNDLFRQTLNGLLGVFPFVLGIPHP